MRIIYETTGRAQEYMRLAASMYRGCGHGCLPCFGPEVLHISREEFMRAVARKDVLAQFERDCRDLAARKDDREILMSFTTDPYQTLDCELHLTRKAIEILIRYGLRFTVLTKAGSRATGDFDLMAKYDKCRFGTSLTLKDTLMTRTYEPGAGTPEARLENLSIAHDLGIPTWASCEPIIFCQDTLALIRRALPIVDEFKIGKLNHEELLTKRFPKYTPPTRLELIEFTREAKGILDEAGKQYMFKKSMAPYLEALLENDGRQI